MPRYIDADKALGLAEYDVNYNLVVPYYKLKKLALEDAEPVRHGHWERVDSIGDVRCSLCHNRSNTSDIGYMSSQGKRCPTCGARMDKEVQE